MDKLITIEEFQARLPAGWKVTEFPTGYKHDDSVWFTDHNAEYILIAEKKGHRLTGMVEGDVRVYGKKEGDEFVFKHDTARGKLTEKLCKEGRWENNNWITIDYHDVAKLDDLLKRKRMLDFDEYGVTCEDVCFGIREATSAIVSAAEEIEKGQTPF